MSTTHLNGLSEIYTFFRKNTTPLYFLSPTPFNILGLDQWVSGFEYINYFDSFDGYHPRVVVPTHTNPPEFQSMEDVNNYLLGHPEIAEHFRRRGGNGKVLMVMFDDESEDLIHDLGLEIALPSNELRQRLDSKVETTRLGNEAGVSSVPNFMGEADSYESLMKQAEENGLGDNLVVQLPYGDSGRTTYFIRGKDDWDKNADEMKGEKLKVMKFVRHIPGTLEAVATRHGTLVGPVMTDITGFEELTPYEGGWCGNDVSTQLLDDDTRMQVVQMASKLGDRLYEEGYKGCFCLDYLLDTDTGDVWLGELNPRISGASPPTNLVTSKYGGAPLMMFHMLEFMDVDFTIDVEEIQNRSRHYDNWNQLVMKQVEDKTELITAAPTSGVWRLEEDGTATFVRRTLDWHTVGDESEAFYLRVYGVGEYRFHGADIGVLVSRGRMQTDDRELSERAKKWIKAITAQFQGVEPAPDDAPVQRYWAGSKTY